MTRVKTRWVLMSYDNPEAIFRTEAEAEKVADFLNEQDDHRPYYVVEVYPSPEVVAAQTRLSKIWTTKEGDVLEVEGMNINHLTNAAHLCLTWTDRFGEPMSTERRAMCQNVRDEIVRRRINEVGR